RLHQDDAVGWTHLHGEAAELAGIELEREAVGEVAVLGVEQLDLDYSWRAHVLAEPAPDAVLRARLGIVGQREEAAEAVGIDALHRRIAHGDRPPQQILEGHAHGAAHRADQLAGLGPEAVRHHGRLARRPRTRSPAA